MKKILAILLGLIFVVTINAQQISDKDHSKLNINCKTCHTCDVPTKNDPCLVICPREKIVTVYQKPEQTPELIVIDQLIDKYGPAYFSHKIHAQMSNMGGGCETCHHHNTSGPILKCKSCHSASRQRDDVSIPDLKGAYHRQCMDCHREWSHSTSCNSCHVPIKEVKGTEKEQIAKRLAGREHPVIVEPTKLVYNTKSDKGKFATFFHNDHTKKFNLECINCHKQEGCSSCHDVNRKSISDKSKISRVDKVNLPFEEQHKKCISCHKNNECGKCHSNKELTPFNHLKSSGWALKSYHEKLNCTKCHSSQMPFKKVDKNCISCHKGWNREKFNHGVTGLKLDEMHIEFSCEDCHAGNNYGVKATCDNCHEGYVYPKYKPGKLISK